MKALHVEGLSLRFGARHVLADLALAVEPGGWVRIEGANGAGKSSLLRCCAGLLEPGAGSIRVAGRPPRQAARAGAIGWSDGDGLVRRLTLRQNLAFRERLRGLARGAQAPALAARAGVAEWLDVPAERCSSGVRARAALAAALLGAPRLLLLDEPLRSVDPESVDSLVEAVRACAPEAAVLWVTHRPEECRDVARTLRLAHGRLEARPRIVRAA